MDVDVLLVPEARREIGALQAFRPAAGTWGVLIGHRRGPRYVVEKVITAGSAARLPDERVLEELDRLWPGGVIGLAVVKPGAAFRKAALGPAWYGKLVLRSTGSSSRPILKAGLVAFERRFFLDEVPFAPAAKENARE